MVTRIVWYNLTSFLIDLEDKVIQSKKTKNWVIPLWNPPNTYCRSLCKRKKELHEVLKYSQIFWILIIWILVILKAILITRIVWYNLNSILIDLGDKRIRLAYADVIVIQTKNCDISFWHPPYCKTLYKINRLSRFGRTASTSTSPIEAQIALQLLRGTYVLKCLHQSNQSQIHLYQNSISYRIRNVYTKHWMLNKYANKLASFQLTL